MNLHSLGEKLTSAMRVGVAHSVSVRRNGVQVGPFIASSPPIGHELITDTGMDISDQNRDFYFDAINMAQLGYPKIGDIVIDNKDNSEWRVLPQNEDYAWRWHGQMRNAYHVITKQDK